MIPRWRRHKRFGPTVARTAIAADIVLRREQTAGATLSEVSEAAHVRVHTDYISPACYLAEPVLARLRADGVEVEYRSFELLPAPAPVVEFGLADERAAWDREVEPLARRLGVAIRRPAFGARSRKAHEAAIFARERGRFDALHAALFAAYFVEGRDIGRIDTVCAIAGEVGLDAAELRVTLGVDTHAEQVERESMAALEAGLTGGPGFVTGTGETTRALSGWHDYDTLRAWLHGRPERDS
jgi:predicted DsbA family dithiol-disulfide isomerase